MSRIAYVNGRYVPHRHAEVSINDRGYQFGDGIYEVVAVLDGHLADEDWHLDRMEYSLSEVSIPPPMSRAALKIVISRMIEMNRLRYGLVYFQVTRGVMVRDHAIDRGLLPQLVMTAKHLPRLVEEVITPVKVITLADQRWQRRDIKTLQLLPNCLAKTRAVEAGAYEALMVDSDGFVTEGSSSNVWIVTSAGALVTRPSSYDILSGITRKAVFELASRRGLKVVERGFTVAEAEAASEVFLTSATSLVTPVGVIDGVEVSGGVVGAVVRGLRAAYYDYVSTIRGDGFGT